MSKFSDFKMRLHEKGLRADYTDEYKRFLDPFFVISCVALATCSYAVLGIFGHSLEGVATWLSTEVPLFEPRIVKLKSIDNYSHLAFSSTILSSALLIPLITLIKVLVYWRLILTPGNAKALNWETVLGTILGTLFFCIFAYLIFVPTFALSHRKSFIFLWQVFPFFAAISATLVAGSFWSVVVVILKLVFLRGVRNGVR